MPTMSISREKLETWWASQPQPLTCFYCGAAPLDRTHRKQDPLRATIDHFIPKARCGSGKFSKNGVVACSPCNRDKGELMPEEWKLVLEYRKKNPPNRHRWETYS